MNLAELETYAAAIPFVVEVDEDLGGIVVDLDTVRGHGIAFLVIGCEGGQWTASLVREEDSFDPCAVIPGPAEGTHRELVALWVAGLRKISEVASTA